jgi:hypothetical protein
MDHPGVVGLDPCDDGISRAAGQIAIRGDLLVLENLSRKRPILVEYPMIVRQQRVEPGSSHVLEGDATILVPGKTFTHALRVARGPSFRSEQHGIDVSKDAPATDTEGLCTPTEREVLMALASGYRARWPRHDPHPRTYEQAAAELGIPESTARKRMEHLRNRLADSGVLVSTGPDSKRMLVEWAIDCGIVAPATHEG